MTVAQERALSIISEQQKSIENTPAWALGEDLKEICLHEPANAEIIAQDLDVPEMSIVHAEKHCKKWADKQKRAGNTVYVPKSVIKEFYGISNSSTANPIPAAQGNISLNFADFM